MLRKTGVGFLLSLVFVFIFITPTNVFAEKGKWSFTPYAGANVASSRDMVEGMSGAGSAAITFSDGSQLAAAVTATIDDLSFDDTHDTPVLAGFDVGYFISDDLEIFSGLHFVTANANSAKVLSITAAGNFTSSGGTVTAFAVGETANVRFDDYDSWDISVGATKYFSMADFTPYIGGYAGYKHIDEMKFKLSFVTTGVSTGSIKFYNESDVGFFGFHTGINKNFNMAGTPLTFGIRARLDYTPELDNDDSDVDLVGAGGTNDAGGGVDFGLTAQLSIPF
jgi:hypothetical protein|tara:strand:+ start:94 stop:933 length:840 start_codon:yes stop_codon:yes gene_type:complete